MNNKPKDLDIKNIRYGNLGDEKYPENSHSDVCAEEHVEAEVEQVVYDGGG